ncbi:MAG: O-acetyl-ADP-ribose deacetylase [Acidiferrobacterales bacterium]
MITVVRADITSLDVDAIVNAANETLLGGGGVDGVIHHAAGPELLAACRYFGGCKTGGARITPGFRLPARWVIHAVGPIWHGGSYDEPRLLESAYRSTFDLALAHGVRTIAFPNISTGAYGYPKDQAAVIALEVMYAFEFRFEQIICCSFSEADKSLYEAFLVSRKA